MKICIQIITKNDQQTEKKLSEAEIFRNKTASRKHNIFSSHYEKIAQNLPNSQV